MNYPLLAYCNRRNAEELAKPREARALGTLDWVPPHVLMWGPGDWRSPHSLGMQLLHGTRGHKISCGAVMDADEYDVREFGTAALSRNNYNVCRPFDEAWERPSPFYYTGLRPLCCEAVGGHPRIVEGMELTYGQPLKTENFSIERHIPPNHGHGSICPCAKWSARLLPNLPDPKRDRLSVQIDHACRVVLAVSKAEAVERQAQALQFRAGNVELPWPKHTECPYELIAKPKGNCKWCEGTGRVVCDQDGRGNQAQHRVSKPMAKEWNRYELFWNPIIEAHEWRLRRKAAIR